jgi:hypothetical protein
MVSQNSSPFGKAEICKSEIVVRLMGTNSIDVISVKAQTTKHNPRNKLLTIETSKRLLFLKSSIVELENRSLS